MMVLYILKKYLFNLVYKPILFIRLVHALVMLATRYDLIFISCLLVISKLQKNFNQTLLI